MRRRRSPREKAAERIELQKEKAILAARNAKDTAYGYHTSMEVNPLIVQVLEIIGQRIIDHIEAIHQTGGQVKRLRVMDEAGRIALDDNPRCQALAGLIERRFWFDCKFRQSTFDRLLKMRYGHDYILTPIRSSQLTEADLAPPAYHCLEFNIEFQQPLLARL